MKSVNATLTKWVSVGYYVWTTQSIIKSYKHSENCFMYIFATLSLSNTATRKTWPPLL